MQQIFWPDRIDAHRLLAHIGSGISTTSFNAKHRIFTRGEDAKFVFFVQWGDVGLTAPSEAGTESAIGLAKEGQFFGEACLYDVPVRMATATAITDCRITSVTKEAILYAINERPPFAKLFIEYLSEHNSWVKKDRLKHLLTSAKED